jgi:hypothetical protein
VALVFGALAAIAVFAAAVGRRGLPLGPAPVLMSGRTWVPAALLGGTALVLATGWWGVGAAVLSAVVAHRLGTRASAGLRTLALIVSLGAGGIALTVAHWPSPSYAGRASWVQLLCVLALGVLWASVLPRTRRVRRGSASA